MSKVEEIDSVGVYVPTRITDTDKLRQERKQKARRTVKLMIESFDEIELHELCHDFQLDYESILGRTKAEKISAIVHYFYRRNTLDMFVNWLAGLRPKIDWPDTKLDPPPPPIQGK